MCIICSEHKIFLRTQKEKTIKKIDELDLIKIKKSLLMKTVTDKKIQRL